LLCVAIVGPEESKWTEEQKVKAKFWIRHILLCFKLANKCTLPLSRDTITFVDNSSKNTVFPITMVSGHCHKLGVDIWAEEIAEMLNIDKLIYPAEVHQWNDPPDGPQGESCMGYKSRNMMIAHNCDILFCIVPYKWDNFNAQPPYDNTIWCKHCKVWNHPSNGGCWTMQYAKKLGKETHLVVIE
jgi:hypothetical protein